MLGCIAGVTAIFVIGVVTRSQWLGLVGLALAAAVGYQCASSDLDKLWLLLGAALVAETVLAFTLLRGFRQEAVP